MCRAEAPSAGPAPPSASRSSRSRCQRAQLATPERVDPLRATLELAERLPSGFQEHRARLSQLDAAAGAEEQRRVPTASSSARIFWLRNGWAMPSRRAARPKCSSSARIDEVPERGQAQVVGDNPYQYGYIETQYWTSMGADAMFSAMDTAPSPRRRIRIGPSQRIAIAMLVGVAVGACFPDGATGAGFHATDLQILSTLFLRMIESMIVPLLFGTLVRGDRRPRRRSQAGRHASPSGRCSTSRSSRRSRSPSACWR